MCKHFEFRRAGLRKNAVRLIHAMVFAMLIALAMPSRAADDRPVRSRVAPTYPEIAKRMKIGGVVRLSVTVDAEGKVTDVKSISGNHALASAAEDAVRRWKFAPGAGEAVVDVDVNFTPPQ